MKSNPFVFRAVFVVMTASTLALASACANTRKKDSDKKSDTPIVADEVSLKSDRSQFAEMRKDIPTDVRRENDELALVLSMLSSSDEEPSKIRERFSKAVRDRREKMDKDLRKKREDFSRAEARSREDFLGKQKDERERFAKGKASGEDRKRFFEDQDLKRKTYFADQADKRKEFEAQVADARKNFEDHIREKTNAFNQEHRHYTSNYHERRKAESLKKQVEAKAKEKSMREARQGVLPAAQSGEADPLHEFRNIPNTPLIPLGPSEP